MGEVKNKVAGNLRKAAGQATGDRDLEARGEGQKAVGKVQEVGRKAKGEVQEAIGKVTGSSGKRAKGKARRA
jgi:uncharacterized protein YjbJ (UPF0337 family)